MTETNTAMILRLQAMALEMPRVLDHPNRMPFSGILTRVGKVSDGAPNGSSGKRVLITQGAAERALPSLLGMGVNLTNDLDGHAPKNKIGLITSAHIDGDALRIEGFVYAADFPDEALRIHIKQADLGFSFEARQLHVESVDADPLVVLDCHFTGASILMKDAAAYRTTSLAAAAAKQKEKELMDAELKSALTEIVNAGIAPIAAAQAAAADRLTKMEKSVSTITERVEANAALVAKVEPVAKGLEIQAAAAEAVGATEGGAQLRNMAAQMRNDAARGIVTTGFSHAGGAVPPPAAPAAPKFEDSDAYKGLVTQIAAANADREKAEKLAEDARKALETQITDLKASAAAAKAGPDRKTLSPQIAAILAKSGVSGEGGTQQVTVAQIDEAVKGLDLSTRMHVKGQMLRQGLVSDGVKAAQ